MDTITKYLSIGLGAIAVILLIYCLLLRNDRDNALNEIDSLNGQLDTVINANCTLTESNILLEKEQVKNRAYITQLEDQKAVTTKKVMEELEKFKATKRTNQPVNDWANTKLPKGIY